MPIYAFSGGLSRPMPQYGAANAKGITHMAFDDERGAFSVLGETGGIDDTAWFVLDAAHKILYSTCEIEGANQSSVTAYTIDPSSAGLTRLSTQQLGGNEACHASISHDGKYLLVGNYNGVPKAGNPDNALTVLPIAPNGDLGPATATIRHEGSGPNAGRQSSAHAHCVISSPDGRFVYVADLGMDRIVAYTLGTDGIATPYPEGDFQVAPGLGPRHLVFHPGGRSLYLVTELIATVIGFAVDNEGRLTQRDAFPIAATSDKIVQPSGIVISADGKFLFTALRVHDEILGLAIDPATGALTQTGRWPSGGATPRDLTLSTSGRHLIVANQDSDLLSVFRVDQETGTLSGPVQQQKVGTPMAIVLAEF